MIFHNISLSLVKILRYHNKQNIEHRTSYLNRLKGLSFLLLIFIFFQECTSLPSGPPPTADCNFVVPAPNQFECFIYHSTTTPNPNQRKVKVMVNIITYYPSNNQKVVLDDQTVTVDPLANPFPITIKAKLPSNNTPFTYECNIESLECSECGIGYYGSPLGATNQCNAGIIGQSGQTLFYQGAKPRWNGGEVNIGSTYYSTLNLRPASRVLNVANSCNNGCGVADR